MLHRLLLVSLTSATLALAQEDPFARLAIPEGALPQDCRLAPQPEDGLGSGRRVVRGPAGLAIDSNPWRGTDRTTVAEIRARVDPAMVPDGPPLHPRDLAAFRRNAADGVVQAYAAVYETAERRQAVLHAVQFESEFSLDAAAKRTRRPTTYRDSATRTLVAVSGDAAACVAALDSHLAAVFGKRGA